MYTAWRILFFLKKKEKKDCPQDCPACHVLLKVLTESSPEFIKQRFFFLVWCNDYLFFLPAWEWMRFQLSEVTQDRNSARMYIFGVYQLKSVAVIWLSQDGQFLHTEVNPRWKLLLSICLSNPGILQSLYPLAKRDRRALICSDFTENSVCWIFLKAKHLVFIAFFFFFFNFYGVYEVLMSEDGSGGVVHAVCHPSVLYSLGCGADLCCAVTHLLLALGYWHCYHWVVTLGCICQNVLEITAEFE